MEIVTRQDDEPQLVNRVAQSAIVTLDLAAIVGEIDVVALDVTPMLHRGLVVREQDFRAAVVALDGSAFAGRHVAVLVPETALMPAWAVMLVAVHLREAASVRVASVESVRADLAARALAAHDWTAYAGKPVVLKGCGTGAVPLDAFAQAARALTGVASKVMFGEPCSAVPVWRAPKAAPASAPVRPAGPHGASAPTARPAGPPRRA